MILIVSDIFDAHADLVEKKLSNFKHKHFRLNLDIGSISNTTIDFKDNYWLINTDNGSINSNDITSIYFRRAFLELTSEEMGLENDINFKLFRGEFNTVLNGLWFSLKSKRSLNPLKYAYAGENKFFQLDVAKQVGFNVPKTIVSNRYSSLKEFIEEHKDVIFKLYNQNVYIENNSLKGAYANKIYLEDLEKKFKGTQNPIVLQEYINKSFEVRWIAIEKEHFVCQINSQESKIADIDWRRYDLANTPHLILKPPKPIIDRVEKLMSLMGLAYGALDFIVTPENKWVFLEINCFGQWLWIENLTGLKISDSIARWLISPQK